jgi:hypothetical protein
MPDSVQSELARMRAILQELETRLEAGEVPQEGLPEFKSTVDEIRMRVWSLLTAAGSAEPRATAERFRLRRAAELCRTLTHGNRRVVRAGRRAAARHHRRARRPGGLNAFVWLALDAACALWGEPLDHLRRRDFPVTAPLHPPRRTGRGFLWVWLALLVAARPAGCCRYPASPTWACSSGSRCCRPSRSWPTGSSRRISRIRLDLVFALARSGQTGSRVSPVCRVGLPGYTGRRSAADAARVGHRHLEIAFLIAWFASA